MCALRVTTCNAYAVFNTSCGRYHEIIVDNIGDNDLPDDVEDHLEKAAEIQPDNTVCGVGGRCVTRNAAHRSVPLQHRVRRWRRLQDRVCLPGDIAEHLQRELDRGALRRCGHPLE